MPLVDPTTGEQYGTAPVSNEQDIDNAYAAAVRAFSDWKHSTPSHRQKALPDFADDVEKAAEALAATPVIGHASVAGDLTDALAEQVRGAATTFGRVADDEDAWVPPVNNATDRHRRPAPG